MEKGKLLVILFWIESTLYIPTVKTAFYYE